ncbi:hypothetical protein B5P44_18100 [Mycobacterium sp. CBMA 213]|nr:hypothetical protein [Mycolicibacterium sp. CBMA 213]
MTFLTEENRARIAVLADLIIPSDAGRPSATEVRVHSHSIDIALNARPDLEEPLTRILDHISEHGTEALPSADECLLTQVIELMIACYFMAPAARMPIDYPGQRPLPIAEGEAEYYLDEGALLEPVVARGDIWRSDGSDHTQPSQQIRNSGQVG